MQKNTKSSGWAIHIPMIVFTAATVALTILDHNGMAIYFAVLTFLAYASTTTYFDNKEDK